MKQDPPLADSRFRRRGTNIFPVLTGVFGGLFLVVLWTGTSQGGPGGRAWGGPGEWQCDDWRVQPGGICHNHDSARLAPASVIEVHTDTLRRTVTVLLHDSSRP